MKVKSNKSIQNLFQNPLIKLHDVYRTVETRIVFYLWGGVKWRQYPPPPNFYPGGKICLGGGGGKMKKNLDVYVKHLKLFS